MENKKNKLEKVPQHILDLGPLPEPTEYEIYDKLKQLVVMRRNKNLRNIGELSLYLRGYKDGLRVTSGKNTGFSANELSIISKLFDVPVELFFSPMTPSDYLLSIASEGDTRILTRQLETLRETVKEKNNLIDSYKNRIKSFEKQIKELRST